MADSARVSQSGARGIVGKSADEVLPGDIVIPSRGRYQGIQCEVKDVLRERYTYRLRVVPVIPLSDDWGVDYGERVRVVRDAFQAAKEACSDG